MLENEQSFNREQNDFLRQERENTEAWQANESNLQRGFISQESYLERQNALEVENRRFANDRQLAGDQRTFLGDQATADRQQALALMREQHTLQDLVLNREQSFAREMQSQADTQRQSDRDHQVTLQKLVEGRITAEAALDRTHQETIQNDQQAWLKQENIDSFNRDQERFDDEMLQRGLEYNETIRQFNLRQADVKTELGIKKQAAQDQASQFKRIHDIQEMQFGRQQNFLEAEAKSQREFQNLQFEEQKGQYSRSQTFAEDQAKQDDLYRAIGTMLAAEESGMDLGIGAEGAAPGGMAALLRGELGSALGLDLANWGQAVEGRESQQAANAAKVREVQARNRNKGAFNLARRGLSNIF